jgi:hypothetical protein
LEGYCIALANLEGKPTSFCDNIINHEIKECFLKYLFHVHYMTLEILIKENEGTTKFFTLMLKGLLEQSYGVYMQYLHHLWIFAFTLKLGGVLHNHSKT